MSGTCFGIFFVLLKEAGDGTGLWPIVGARLGNLVIVVVALLVLATRGGAGPRVSGRTLIGLALLSGVLDAGANVLYFLAVNEGLLSLAAVLTSLYPAITVLLARIAHSERLRTVQRVGMAVAVAGRGPGHSGLRLLPNCSTRGRSSSEEIWTIRPCAITKPTTETAR